jgi:1,2-dihydroxy-3-keto-5-methylthiopentene dioxygenase
VSRLRILDHASPSAPRVDTADGAEIARHLSAAGVRFERWRAAVAFAPDAAPQAVIEAYRRDIDRLMDENGYRSVDVIRMLPDNPQRAELRAKFLNEHIHTEDEVRFFVEGAGAFYLHMHDEVHTVLCESGDLIGVPANTTHWFDMGPEPRFTAIRLFTNPDGWVARFSGSDISERFPRLGE